MEITQVIAAYRNPFEMWLWESGSIYILVFFYVCLMAYMGYKIWNRNH